MVENRSSPRKRTLKSGKILLNLNARQLDCKVRNFSTDGACLKVAATFGIPARFDLVHDAKRYTCRVVWISETELGVMFV